MNSFVDAHCHLYEFDNRDIEEFKNILIIAVSDDAKSSYKTIELAEEYSNIIPAIGLHPWSLKEVNPKRELKEIRELVEKYDVKVLGEIGLDKKFVPETFSIQRMVFRELLGLAREYGLRVNLHAAGAWREVFNEVLLYDLDSVVFHWYTGPLDLLDEIVAQGYYISINPAIKVQEKHRRVLEYVKLDYILTESDGPYDYRGLKLTPKIIPDLLNIISTIKRVPENDIKWKVYENFRRYLK